jgi:small subunit ribosomal protein S17
VTIQTETEKPVRRRASRTGVVTKDKMDKSVVVRVDRTIKHDRYKRYIRRTSRFMAHDENNDCRVGDTVEIVESRPLSLRKRWRVRRIVRSAVGSASTVGSGKK